LTTEKSQMDPVKEALQKPDKELVESDRSRKRFISVESGR